MQAIFYASLKFGSLLRRFLARIKPGAGRVYLPAALLLAFLIGSVGQIPAVQAAQASNNPSWYLDVANPKTKICVGDEFEYETKVFFVNQTTPRSEWPLPAVKVEATSTDKSVGSFKQDTAITGFANEDLVTASFSFKAKKTGATTLYFEGFADIKFRDTYVSFTVPVAVINCKYKVTSRSTWMQQMEGGTVFLNGFMIGVKMTGDDTGKFTVNGPSNVTWVMTSFVPNYSTSNTVQFGNADLSAQLQENNQLNLNLTLNTPTGSETNCGAAGCGFGDVSFTPQPLLNINFPAEGGTRRVSHLLKGPAGMLTGSTVITVKVEKP